MPEPNAHAWLAKEWTLQLSRVIESMTGDAPAITFEALTLPEKPETEGWLWWEQPFSLSSDARIWAGASDQTWNEIGGRVLRSAGIEDGDAANIRNTYLEIIRQALAAVAATFSTRWRKEVSCIEGRELPPSTGNIGYSFQIVLGDATVSLTLAIAAAILKSPDTPVAESAAPDPRSLERSPQLSTGNSSDLLLDVELPVRVSFGRAQIALKDVIKLTTGSIVELNRAVTEPVEIIVNNCVIARGEVVVVEGNFGVRIKQVVSRQERLRTLY